MHTGGDSDSTSDSNSNEAVVAIACVVTLFYYDINCYCYHHIYCHLDPCQKKFTSSYYTNATCKQPIAAANIIVYYTVGPPSQTSNAADLEMQPNPGYAWY